ncbi:hypothetical protein C2W64_04171 [Brevibacillus laterosporus]|nr:hypothetical protein C2W64_04171 [Brevibacillus laterosporus]
MEQRSKTNTNVGATKVEQTFHQKHVLYSLEDRQQSPI